MVKKKFLQTKLIVYVCINYSFYLPLFVILLFSGTIITYCTHTVVIQVLYYRILLHYGAPEIASPCEPIDTTCVEIYLHYISTYIYFKGTLNHN